MYVQFSDSANPGVISPNSQKYYVVQAHIDRSFYDIAQTTSDYLASMTPCDYALLTVSEDLSDRYHFNLGIPYNMTSYPVTDYNIYVTGFPQDLDSNTRHLYTGTGNILSNLSVEGSLLSYNTVTAGGNSGGPVYLKESYDANSAYGEYNTVIGIHVMVGANNRFAPVMTPIKLKFYLSNPNIAY